jgi:hypothetical protein
VNAPGKRLVEFEKPDDCGEYIKETGEEKLQSAIPECNSNPGIGNAVLCGLRKSCVTSGLIFLLFRTVTLKYLPLSRLAHTNVCSISLTSSSLIKGVGGGAGFVCCIKYARLSENSKITRIPSLKGVKTFGWTTAGQEYDLQNCAIFTDNFIECVRKRSKSEQYGAY